MQTFTAQEMQRNVGAVQEAALAEPVIITYHNRPRLVLLSMREFDSLRGRARRVGSVEEADDVIMGHISELAEMDSGDEEPTPSQEPRFAKSGP